MFGLMNQKSTDEKSSTEEQPNGPFPEECYAKLSLFGRCHTTDSFMSFTVKTKCNDFARLASDHPEIASNLSKLEQMKSDPDFRQKIKLCLGSAEKDAEPVCANFNVSFNLKMTEKQNSFFSKERNKTMPDAKGTSGDQVMNIFGPKSGK